MLGAPLGLHHPQAARAGPGGMHFPAFTQVDLSFMLNLSMTVAFSTITSLGGYSHRHGAGAWVRPCHVDKPERSSSGSRHAPRTSPHQALSAFTSSSATSGRLTAVTVNRVSSCACSQGFLGRIAGGTASLLCLVRFACVLKGGLLSIATQELLLALQPSPPGLDHGIATWHTSGS